jgi:transcription initiation factor TFIID subunit 7
LWNFHCDGATYPARLVNLPCPVELHKTHDHAMYFKCCDLAQMLIVYEDSMALDEADAYPKTEGYPSYYHSGLTTALKRVVERRFALREHVAVPPPRAEVSDVEKELHELMCKISKEGGKRNKVPSLASAQHANKILEEVVEEIVDYEPWMDDYGRQLSGIEIEASDQLASQHPEIWLTPEQIDEIKAVERAKEEEELKKKQAATAKKEKKKKKQQKELEPPAPSKKKGIASKKHEEPVDEVTQAALEMTVGDLMDAVLDEDDPLDFGFDLDNMDDIPP